MSLYPLSHDQIHPQKRRRVGRDTNSHGPTSEVALVDVDLVVFGRFEIKPWFPSPYVLDAVEYHQATSAQDSSSSNPPPTIPPRHHLLDSHHHHQRSQTHLKLVGKLPSESLSSNLHLPTNAIRQARLTGRSDRSQTPDSLSSLDTGSAPLDLPTNHQHPLHIHKDHHYPSSSHSHLPSSISDHHPTSPPQSHPPNSSLNGNIKSDSILPSSPFLKLYVCDGCLKYMVSADSFRQHKIRCKMSHPPGRKVYQSGKIIIREIDGTKSKLYCQCLCLFGKLFIDHKYIFFDVEGFKFYVLTVEEKLGVTSTTTTGDSGTELGIGLGKQKKESIMGFFSKEKISYDGYNLACIVTLPPYQKKGYGTLLIAFSYELDRFEAGKDENGLPKQEAEGLYLGTPERPLSTLGAKGYLSFWTAVLVRFFRTLFPPPPPRIEHGTSHKSTKRNNLKSKPSMMIEMTLEEISRSTRLRPDDAAFALISSGLTKFRKKKKQKNNNLPNGLSEGLHLHDDDIDEDYGDDEDDSEQDTTYVYENGNKESNEEEVIVITRDLVEQVAQRANVKSAILDPRHILINYTNFDNQSHNDDDDDDDEDHSYHSLECSDHVSDRLTPSSP